MARNRQRRGTGRPRTGPRPDSPTPADDAIGRPAPEGLADVFADDDDDGRSALSADLGGGAAADAAFGAPSRATERRPLGARVAGFLRGSWAELQRVQWPDRQQVAQATGVVLGFVLVTAIFLGAADFLAGKLVNWIV